LNEDHEMSVHNLRGKSQRLAEASEELKIAQAQLIEKELLERELQQARELQRSILPQVLPHLEGYDLGARMVPARMIGGDFYDVIPLDTDHLGLAVGDISGKGIPAALFMSLTCSLLRVEAKMCMSPYRVLQQVNQHILAINAQGIFVTLLYGILHLPTCDFTYARAGHELPLLWDSRGAIVPITEGRGQPLGLFTKPLLDRKKIKLAPDSTLLLYSDGVTEAQDAKYEFFGLEGMQRIVPGLLENTAQGVCDQIVDELLSCCHDVQKIDDITLLALKVLPRL
jgi:sigma-B regulation protein RsbU (phosphoserine phosphatase)